MHFKKNLLQTRLSFILAIMLVNSCASTSNNDFKLLENQKQENFPELLSINDLFVINELNEDKAKNERELILELLKYESLDTNEANKLNAIIPSTLKPYGKRIIEGILQNNKKLHPLFSETQMFKGPGRCPGRPIVVKNDVQKQKLFQACFETHF